MSLKRLACVADELHTGVIFLTNKNTIKDCLENPGSGPKQAVSMVYLILKLTLLIAKGKNPWSSGLTWHVKKPLKL